MADHLVAKIIKKVEARRKVVVSKVTRIGSFRIKWSSHKSSVPLFFNHRPQVKESVDEGVGDGVSAGEDEETVLEPVVQFFEGILVDQKPKITAELVKLVSTPEIVVLFGTLRNSMQNSFSSLSVASSCLKRLGSRSPRAE